MAQKKEKIVVTSRQFQNAVGRYLDQSTKQPVYISRHNRPVSVLVDVEEFERLKQRDEPAPKAMTKKNIINLLRQHKDELVDLGIDHLVLFGSFARDEAGPESDVDLHAQFNPSARVGLVKLIQIEDHLSALLHRPVDLLSGKIEKERLRMQIEQDQVRVF